MEFEGLGAFLAFLPRLAADVTTAQQQGRHAAVAVVRQAVADVFGESEGGEDGPFPVVPDLQPATQAARVRHGFAADEPEVATGTLRASIGGTVADNGRAAVGVPDEIVGSGRPGDPFRNIGDVAVAQEEGTGILPPRPLLGIGGFRAAQDAAGAFVAPVIAALAGRPLPETTRQGDTPHGDD